MFLSLKNCKASNERSGAQGMLEGSSLVKKHEKYPLLMVAGAGDAAVLAPPYPRTPIWSNNNIVHTRRPWSERWPEYLSSCWMTFILLGVSFVVFYAIGILVLYRAETYVLVRCNDTKPASNVYYHSVIPRGGIFPLMSYSSYLATMAATYPSLRFHVVFLLDDSIPFMPKRSSFYSKLYPHTFYEELNIYNRRELRDFRKKYTNVNVTVMPLSRFMALTPLKYKWRTYPVPHLPFYARVWSVWSTGGIGLDLVSQNEMHLKGHLGRTDAILRQHNDGINAEKYTATLDKMLHDDQDAIYSSFFNMFQKMLNDTFSLFNNTFPFAFPGENNMANEEFLKRSKRDILQEEDDIIERDSNTHPKSVVNIVLANTSVVNVTGDTNKENVYQLSSNNSTATEISTDRPEILNNLFNTEAAVNNETSSTELKDDEDMTTSDLDHDKNDDKKNNSECAQVVFVYDFSIVSESVQPDIEPQKLVVSRHGIQRRNLSNRPKYVTLESEGTFIAATSQMHPFLASILAAGSKSVHPRLAIKNALISQCSGMFRDESYCDTIYIL